MCSQAVCHSVAVHRRIGEPFESFAAAQAAAACVSVTFTHGSAPAFEQARDELPPADSAVASGRDASYS